VAAPRLGGFMVSVMPDLVDVCAAFASRELCSPFVRSRHSISAPLHRQPAIHQPVRHDQLQRRWRPPGSRPNNRTDHPRQHRRGARRSQTAP